MSKLLIFIVIIGLIFNVYSEEIKLDKEIYKQGEIIKGEVITDIPFDIIEIEWIDSYDRIVEKQNTINKTFEFKTSKAITWWNKIKVNIKNQEKILTAEKEFDVIFEQKKWDDYEVIYWTSYGEKKDLKDQDTIKFYKMLQELGIGAVGTTKFQERHLINSNTKFFVHNICHPWFYSTWKIFTEEKYDKTSLVRNPCLNAPYEELFTINQWIFLAGEGEKIEEPKKRIKEILTNYKNYNPLYYCIADEPSIICSNVFVDLCFCPHCMTKMRIWLQKEYGDLKKLNKEWETDFKTWDEVIPLTYNEVKTRKNKNYSPWADHRTFMDLTMRDAIIMFKQWIQEIDSNIPCGISGTYRPSCYGGYDYWKLLQTIDVIENYDIGGETEIIRSFVNKDFVHYYQCSGATPEGKFMLWYRLLHGARMNSAWTSNDVIDDNNLTFTKNAKFAKETYQELKSGICKLLYYSEPQIDKIAIHYSQPSIQAAYTFFSEPSNMSYNSYFNKNRIIFEKIIEDLGLQYKYVAYEQIENGLLTKEKYKVLILPLSIAISKKEKKKIEEFVRNGGIVIADRMAGIMDNHCKLQRKGLLNNIFGIKTKESRKFIINNYGKGKGVYLNLDISDYLNWREGSFSDTGEKIKEIIDKTLKSVDIKRKVKIIGKNGKELPYIEICRFKQGELEYVGIRKNPFAKILDTKIREVTIEFDKNSYVYDIREKKSFGLTNKIEVDFNPIEVKIFALLPYEIKDIDINIAENISLGETVNYEVKIIASQENIGIHIINVEIIKPDGQVYVQYSKNLLAEKNITKGQIPFAVNDPNGKWQIKVTDVASGYQKIKEILVK